ncbi:MAG: holo-ACP synthase [Candidatus Omnitrophica bacterium]|nr:holo-ACP synthase [Candidatus Omnitrophota bacterium]
MAITTGVDIVNVNRIKRIIQSKKKTFLQRIFSEKEIEYCEKKVNKYQHYAARFAAKEAFLKALPHGPALLTYKDIEVYRELSAPSIRIRDQKRKGIKLPKTIALSISHEKEFAVAVVVLEYR